MQQFNLCRIYTNLWDTKITKDKIIHSIAVMSRNHDDVNQVSTFEVLRSSSTPTLNYYKADLNIYAGEYPFAKDIELGKQKLKILKE